MPCFTKPFVFSSFLNFPSFCVLMRYNELRKLSQVRQSPRQRPLLPFNGICQSEDITSKFHERSQFSDYSTLSVHILFLSYRSVNHTHCELYEYCANISSSKDKRVGIQFVLHESSAFNYKQLLMKHRTPLIPLELIRYNLSYLIPSILRKLPYSRKSVCIAMHIQIGFILTEQIQ